MLTKRTKIDGNEEEVTLIEHRRAKSAVKKVLAQWACKRIFHLKKLMKKILE